MTKPDSSTKPALAEQSALSLALQNQLANHHDAPCLAQVRAWAAAAVDAGGRGGELTVRMVDNAEMAALNARYRGKTGATNVLSFPFDAPPGVAVDILGDVVICAPVVAAQAAALGKPPMAHWAHMVIHGILHLCGFDHQRRAQAMRMEALERALLTRLDPGDWHVDATLPPTPPG